MWSCCAAATTHVCEFHYLHHDAEGAEYEDPLLMAWTLADAADAAGIGLTLLPVLYERRVCRPALRHDQRRFATSADSVLDAQRRITESTGAGIGDRSPLERRRGKSIRRAPPVKASIARGRHRSRPGPIHIHVAEQMVEVEECQRVTGAAPGNSGCCKTAGLMRAGSLCTPRMSPAREIEGVKPVGARAVIRPTTRPIR